MKKKQQKVWSVSWCVQVPEETGPKTLEILNVVFLIEILSTEKKDAIKMRNGLKLCYFDHSWTGWFQWTFFFGKVWMEMFSVPKPARTSWPCLSSITLLLFFPFSFLCMFPVRGIVQCGAEAHSLRVDKQLGPQRALQKTKMTTWRSSKRLISHFQTKLLIPDWLKKNNCPFHF